MSSTSSSTTQTRVVGAIAALALGLVLPAAARAALGQLDPAWGTGGIASAPASGAKVEAATVDSAGKALVAGGGSGGAMLVRFDSQGRADDAFNSQVAPSLRSVESLHALAIHHDDHVVAAGVQLEPETGLRRGVVVRFLNDGRRDFVASMPSETRLIGIAVLPDRRIVVGGDFGMSFERALFVARLMPDGRPDPSFGGNGSVIRSLPGGSPDTTAMALDAQGNVLLGGRIEDFGSDRPAFVARITPGGDLDAGFGTGGAVLFGDANTFLEALAVLPDGGILAAGTVVDDSTEGRAGLVRRIEPNGALGAAQHHLASNRPLDFAGLAVTPVGRVLAGGRAIDSTGHLVLGQVDGLGRLDPVLDPFGPQPGLVVVPGTDDASSGAVAASDSAGRPHLAGTRGTTQVLVTRHLPNAPPTAAFTAPAQLAVGQPGTFDASSSTDPENALRRFEWDFDGDGTFESDRGPDPRTAQAFGIAGRRRVGLRVTDHEGLQATAARDVEVVATTAQPPPPGLTPKLGRTGVLSVVSGVIRIRVRGSRRFVRLRAPRELPEGSEIDARRGRVRLTVARDAGGATDSAVFYRGRFRFTQADGKRPFTTATLTGGSFRGCGPARPRLRVRLADAAARRKSPRRVIRRLWGDGKGRFRTKGRYAAATVRGTRWQTVDRCDGVLLVVADGVVHFRDLLRGTRTRRVRAGRRDFVPSGRGRR